MKSRSEYEKEVKERRADLQKQERRLQQGRELERRMAETPLVEVPVGSSGPL